MLQGLKMRKLLLFSLPAMFACGGTPTTHTGNITAQEVSAKHAAICETRDASARDEMDAGKYDELCGKPKVCEEFEAEMVCEGEWCIIHRTCRLH